MTDNDDPAPPRGDPFSAGSKDEPGTRPGRRDAAGRARITSGSARFAPTDPEVPSAKRRGALRHQRSLVGLTAVVMGLLSITLALLYRASQQVRARDETTVDAPPSQGTRSAGVPSSIEPVHKSTLTPPSSPSAAQSGSEHRDETAIDDNSNDSAPAESGTPSKSPPPALDIIRTPAF